MSNQYKVVKCRINGKNVEQIVDVRSSLTDMLRNDFRLTSVKKGCEVGECGACTVLVNGEPINSCLCPVINVVDKEVIQTGATLFAGGKGTEKDPYLIATPEQL